MKRVVGMVAKESGNILLVKDAEGEYWTFPGGKIEEGESPSQALKREISEELPGLTIFHLRHLGEFEGITPHSRVPMIATIFLADVRGSIELGQEITASKWASPLDIIHLKLNDMTREIILSGIIARRS